MGIEADEEEAAFAQGFSDKTPEPAQAAAPEPEKPAQAEPEQTPNHEPAATDPFAGLPQQVRDLLANIPALEQRVQAAETNFRAAQGRIASLQSRFDKTQQQPKVDEAPSAQHSRFKAVEAIRQELPEIAAAFDELTAAQPQPRAEPQTEANPDPVQQSDPQIDALNELRPTWGNDVQTSDFQLWLAQQPAQYRQAVVNSDKAKDILAALGQFDKYRSSLKTAQQTNATRSTRMAGAVTPQGDGRRPERVMSDEDAEDAAFKAGFHGR